MAETATDEMPVRRPITVADWNIWSPNQKGSLGMTGEVYPDSCPIGKDQCDRCGWFMGHRVEAPAYVGQSMRFCCGHTLRDTPSPATIEGD